MNNNVIELCWIVPYDQVIFFCSTNIQCPCISSSLILLGSLSWELFRRLYCIQWWVDGLVEGMWWLFSVHPYLQLSVVPTHPTNRVLCNDHRNSLLVVLSMARLLEWCQKTCWKQIHKIFIFFGFLGCFAAIENSHDWIGNIESSMIGKPCAKLLCGNLSQYISLKWIASQLLLCQQCL